MDFEFLNNFDIRMKRVGTYALLYKNSIQRTTWKNYGFVEFDEQSNLIFSVLLYIMEQSLKEESCTMDDIGDFIDSINMRWFKKELSYEQCKELADFVVNTVLCDDGKAMYFNGYDFNEGSYKEINVSFLGNKIIYIDESVRRTSYYLTDDGYSLILSTLEIESNMKLTIHEMIFKMHIEKASYDKAVDEIKNIFNLLRIQVQKMNEAMRKIRQNALSYSVQEYKTLLEENLSSLNDTKKKFDNYKIFIKKEIKKLEERDINIKKLDKKEKDNLNYLRIIEGYLNRSIDEQQKILITHFDLKSLYTKELEDISQMSLIKRFNIRTEIYDKILKDCSKLEEIDSILRVLLQAPVEKTYNINKCLQYQRPIKGRKFEEDEEVLNFDEEQWQEEENRKKREKLKKYNEALKVIIDFAMEYDGISLLEISEALHNEEELKNTLIPTVEIFREIVIELIKNKYVNISELIEEKKNTIFNETLQFQLNEALLEVIDDDVRFKSIKAINAYKINDGKIIKFKNVNSEDGTIKVVTCSDVYFQLER